MLKTFSLELWINRVSLPILLVRGQLNSENELFSLSPFAPENLVPQEGFDRPVLRHQPALVLHTQLIG